MAEETGRRETQIGQEDYKLIECEGLFDEYLETGEQWPRSTKPSKVSGGLAQQRK